MKNNLISRRVDLEKRIEVFLSLKENAIKLIQEMGKVEKKHQKGGTEKQFRMLMAFLRKNGIWEERIDFDIKPDSGYFEADKHLFVEELSYGDGYSLNFQEDKGAKDGKVSKFIVSEENEGFVNIFDEKYLLEVNLGKFARGEDFRDKVNELRGIFIKRCEEAEKKGLNLDDVYSEIEVVIPFERYTIYQYSKKVFDKIDLKYFTGKDILKRIIGLYILIKAQEGDIKARIKIKSILGEYFNGVVKNFVKERLSEKFGKEIILDDIQTLEIQRVTGRIMEKVLFGNNFKDLNYFLKLDNENELALKSEESANKKIMNRLIENFKKGFLEYLEKADYSRKKLEIIFDFNLFKKGDLKFVDIEDDIIKEYLPILSTGLSPIEAIGCFFNEKMLKKTDYFKRLVYYFKSELENWIDHKSNPLDLKEKEKNKVSLDKEVNFSKEDGRKLKDTLGGEDDSLNEKITKLDLFLIEKRIVRKAKTDFQKKKIERDFKILKLNYEGYLDEEIGKKLKIGKRAVFKTRKLLAKKIKKELYC